MDERRKSLRHTLEEANEDVITTFITIKEEVIKVKCLNLSLNGIGIDLDRNHTELINSSSSYKIKMVLSGKTTINAMGRFIWKVPVNKTPEESYTLGFQIFISDETQRLQFKDFLNNFS